MLRHPGHRSLLFSSSSSDSRRRRRRGRTEADSGDEELFRSRTITLGARAHSRSASYSGSGDLRSFSRRHVRAPNARGARSEGRFTAPLPRRTFRSIRTESNSSEEFRRESDVVPKSPKKSPSVKRKSVKPKSPKGKSPQGSPQRSPQRSPKQRKRTVKEKPLVLPPRIIGSRFMGEPVSEAAARRHAAPSTVPVAAMAPSLERARRVRGRLLQKMREGPCTAPPHWQRTEAEKSGMVSARGSPIQRPHGAGRGRTRWSIDAGKALLAQPVRSRRDSRSSSSSASLGTRLFGPRHPGAARESSSEWSSNLLSESLDASSDGS